MQHRFFPRRYSVTIDEAIDCMVATLESPGRPVLLSSTLDRRGFVGPGDCFALDGDFPSADVVFRLAVTLGAPAMLCGSRATHSALVPDEADVELTRWLSASATERGIYLDEHILVHGRTFRAMRKSIEEGLC